VLTQLEVEKRLVLKLLALGTVDLSEDVGPWPNWPGVVSRPGCLEEVTTAVAKAMKAEESKLCTRSPTGFICINVR
jgi:hypothetical protein